MRASLPVAPPDLEAQHLQRREHHAGVVADARGIALQIARLLPVRHQVRAGGAVEIAGQRVDPVVADGAAEVLRGDVLELMRLVDDRPLAERNDLAVGAVPHGGVRAQAGGD